MRFKNGFKFFEIRLSVSVHIWDYQTDFQAADDSSTTRSDIPKDGYQDLPFILLDGLSALLLQVKIKY